MKTWHLTGITSQIKGRWWQAPSEKPDTNCPTSLLISTFWKMSNCNYSYNQQWWKIFSPSYRSVKCQLFSIKQGTFYSYNVKYKKCHWSRQTWRKVSHHCPLFVGEVDSDGSSTSGWILWTGLPWGGVGGGGGGHGERQEGIGGGQGGKGRHSTWTPKPQESFMHSGVQRSFALYLEPTQTQKEYEKVHIGMIKLITHRL